MMEAKVKKTILRRYLRKQLFEQTEGGYGVGEEEYSPFPEEGGEELELPKEVPISPSDQMATQLSTQRPPVEDPEYIPSSAVELGKAAEVLSQLVPEGQIEFFYSALQSLVDEAEERAANVEVTELEPLEMGINEQAEGDLVGLEDLAKEFGYSAASGVRQDLERILKRLSYTVEGVRPEDLETLKLYATNEFIDAMLSGGYIDDNDAIEFQQNPSEVMMLDSFRFFLVSGLILPAYQKITRNARKRVEAQLDSLGIPKNANQTIINQVFGDTPKDTKKIQAKLDKVGAGNLFSTLLSRLDTLEKVAALEGDLVSDAIESFGRTSPARKQKILVQALQSTTDFKSPESK